MSFSTSQRVKRKICVQKVISYKEQKLSQCSGKQNYVIKSEENSGYYYLSNRKIIEVVFSSRESLLAFYFQERFTAHKMVLSLKRRIKLVCQGNESGHVKKYLLIKKKKKRVLIQPGERRRNQVTNKSNEQSEKYSPLWKCSKLFIPPQTDGMIRFSFNIGCSESKVIFK